VLGHDVLRTDHWKLKGTMQQLADRLGTDHGTISRWLHRGILPPSVESFLMACPTRPPDWHSPIDSAFNSRHRAGFLDVAKYLYGRRPGHAPSDGDALVEIHVEILFAILDRRAGWDCVNFDLEAAVNVVLEVCEDQGRDIIPVWYIKREKIAVLRLINRLRADERFAFRYLSRLYRNWKGVFALARIGTENMGWSNSWHDASN
jgi:hypothetical protein